MLNRPIWQPISKFGKYDEICCLEKVFYKRETKNN